jgi:hypothetical protein
MSGDDIKKKCFRHPLARIFTCFLIVVLDFYIYAEDPILDSRAQSNLPVIGNVVNLLRLPPSTDESVEISTFVRWVVHLFTGAATTIISIFVIRTILPKITFSCHTCSYPCPCNQQCCICECEMLSPTCPFPCLGKQDSCTCDCKMLFYIVMCVLYSTLILLVLIGVFNQVEMCMSMMRSILTGLCIALGGMGGTGIRSWLSKNQGCRVLKEDRGAWLFCAVGVIGMVYFESRLFGWLTTNEIFQVQAGLGISNIFFGRIAQCCTWVGDMITIVMVLDSMCQDGKKGQGKAKYPDWCGCLQKKIQESEWMRWGSIGVFILMGTGVIVAGIAKWMDSTNLYDGIRIPVGETARVVVVCLITAVDLIIIIQDWDFPTFDNNNDFSIPCFCLVKKNCIRINHKWLQYGPLLVIIMLDINMLKNQIVYKPSNFAQYIHPSTHEIWTISDLDSIVYAFDPHGVLLNDSTINWNDRELARATTVEGVENLESDIKSGGLYWGDDGFARGVLVGMLTVGVFGFAWHVRLNSKLTQPKQTLVPEEYNVSLISTI